PTGEICTQVRCMPQDAWRVTIPDHHPGYITQAQFLANDAAQRVLELETEFANFERQALRTITGEQKQQILQLVSDFPRLWTAPTTEPRDRKRMLRLLIKDITVVKGPEPKLLKLKIRWQGDATEVVELQLPANRPDVMRYSQTVIDRVRDLAREHD